MRKSVSVILVLFASIAAAKGVVIQSCQPAFAVKLKANPTTGYHWFLAKYNHQLLQPVSMRYIAPKQKMPGAGGEEEITFKADPQAFVVPQVLEIKFVYARPWENKPAKSHTVEIYTQKTSVAPDGAMLCQNNK